MIKIKGLTLLNATC